MGKQKIYVNGKLAKEHFGGYLPVIVNLKEQGLKKGDKCVVAVMADNSNDKSYPPGKPQYTLDFAYHGGIYRDVWLINKKEISITNVIEADRRDAGIFVRFLGYFREAGERCLLMSTCRMWAERHAR